MLQAVNPIIQSVVRNPTVQRAGFAILCGVGTFYTIRTTEGARKGIGGWLAAKREAAAARKAAKASVKVVEKPTTEASAVVVETPAPDNGCIEVSVSEVVSAREAQEEPTPAVENSSLEEAIKVIMEGASFNQLRAKAKELGLKFEGNPTKLVLATALAEQAAAAPAA